MSQLFRRAWQVIVDTLDVSALHIEFRVLRTIKREPNKASVTLWNINEDHRAQLLKRNNPNPGKKLAGVPVQVKAGYGTDTTLLLAADLDTVGSTLEGTNWKTVISGSDAGRSYREGRINTQFSAGTLYGTILKQCCDAMGIGLGNASDFTAQAQLAGVGQAITKPFVSSGNAGEVLDRVVRSMVVNDANGNKTTVTWSVQNGALQLQQKGQPLNLAAIEISPETGLVGSPESSIDSTVSLGNPQQFAAGAKVKNAKAPKPNDPSIVKFKTLLIPGMVPGRKITLKSAEFNGGYMLTEVLSYGASYGNDWYHECVARQYT